MYLLPCYWSEVEVEPAVAMVAGVLKGEEVAGCSVVEEAASCLLEEASDLQETKPLIYHSLCVK